MSAPTHLRPMQGWVVGVLSPDTPPQGPGRAVLVDIGNFGEQNSSSYVYSWPEGLEVGCPVVFSLGFGVHFVDGYVYLQPGAIIGWEPQHA